jgi:hypothetical protein
MLQKDIQALNDRFFDNMDAEDIQLTVENQPDQDLDDTKLWTKWIINPGLSTSVSMGRDFLVTQYGTATLQIFVPKGLYTGPGIDLREQFNTLFRGWRSADRKLRVDDLRSTSSTYKENFHLINAMVMWHSKRRTSDS